MKKHIKTIDTLGMIRRDIDALERREKSCCNRLKKMGHGRFEGDRYTAHIYESSSSSLSLAEFKEKLPKKYHKLIENCTKVNVFDVITVKRK